MAEVRRLRVQPAEDGVRLDRFLKRRWPNLSQIDIFRLARTGQLRVDGKRVKADTRLRSGASVRVPPVSEAAAPGPRDALTPAEIAFVKSLVLWQDDELLVLDKPAGLAVQGGTKTTRHLDRLLGAWGEGERRPRLVHRLDRDTSGVIAVAKSAAAAGHLAAAFAERRARKSYWALVSGVPEPRRGRIELPLAKLGGGQREQMAPTAKDDPRGQAAVTDYVVMRAVEGGVAWLALRPITGRTHQLRAHLLAIGHPILGDPKYKTAASATMSRGLELQLHARRVVLPRSDGGEVDVSAPLSPQMHAGFARYDLTESDGAADPFDAPTSAAAP